MERVDAQSVRVLRHRHRLARNVYSTHHNPAVYYDDVEGARYNEAFSRAPKRECLHKVIATGTTAPNDMSTFNTRLARGRVARFNFVIPNDCEQGHDPCGANRLRQFDVFLNAKSPNRSLAGIREKRPDPDHLRRMGRLNAAQPPRVVLGARAAGAAGCLLERFV
jgi:hypothetical protein